MNKEKQNIVPALRFPEFVDFTKWEKKPFSKLFKIGSGRDYKHLGKGDIPVYGTGGYMLSVNDFLYDGKSACIGRKGTINKPMFLTGKFWTVDTLFYTHSFRDCSPEFIYLLFQNINWLNYNEAGGVPSLSKVIINKIEVFVPQPKEQQKIANCLSSLDTLISAETDKLAHLQDHKKGLLQQLFPKAGETKPQYRFPEFVNDGDWEEKPLSKVFSIFQGYSFSSKDSVEEGTRWLKIADVSIQIMNHNNPSFLPDDYTSIYEKFLIKKGDYVLALTRPILNGKLKISPVDDLLDNSLLNQRVGKLISNENLTLVYYLLQTNNLIEEIERSIAGSEPPNLSMKQIENIEISLPSNPKEQQKIANCLSSADALIAAQSSKIESLQAHKKGLMQQLFPTLSEP